jgi:CheY-like chemotaxis protein
LIDLRRGAAPRHLWGALGLLAAGLLCTVLASLYIKAGVEAAAQREFDFTCNDILDFSKIEAKRLDLETLDFDLSSLLDDFASALALRAQEKGLEATRHIRDPRSAVLNHWIPIIAMTAHAMQGDRDRCLEAGMDDYLFKPVTPQALAEVLDKWLPPRDANGGSRKAA